METSTILKTPNVLGETKSREFKMKTITGIKSIDNTINGLCPYVNEEKSLQLKQIIQAYFFGKQFIARLILDMTNSEATEYIEEIGMLVKQNKLNDFKELEIFLEKCYSSINFKKCDDNELNTFRLSFQKDTPTLTNPTQSNLP